MTLEKPDLTLKFYFVHEKSLYFKGAFMKRFITYLLAMSLSLFGNSLYSFTQPQQIPNVDPFELLNNMPPEELDKILDELSKMSPEDIKYYEDLGKQMFKQSGYDLDELQKAAPTQPAKPVVQAPKIEKPKTAPTPAENETSKKEKDSLVRMMRQLSESLASIRQKAAMDETLHTIIASLHYDHDLLAAYSNRIDYERHLKHFSEKEFSGLKTKLRKMSLELTELDDNLSVPEVTFKNRAQTQQSMTNRLKLQEASNVLSRFKNYMQNAFTSDTIIPDIEKLFKKYDEEALTIKKGIEEQQKKAAEQVKKLPTTNTGVFAPPSKYGQQQGAGNRSGHGQGQGGGYSGGGAGSSNRAYPSVSGSTPQQPGASKNPQQAGKKSPNEKGKDGKDGEKGKEEKGEPAAVPQTPEERVDHLKKDLRTVNVKIAQNKNVLLKIASDLTTTAIPAGPVGPGGAAPAPVPAPSIPTKESVDMLDEVVVLFTKVREDLTRFFKDMHSKDNNKIKIYKTQLKEFFEPASLPELHQLQHDFVPAEAVVLPPAAAAKPDAVDAKKLIKKFLETFNGINSTLSSTRSAI